MRNEYRFMVTMAPLYIEAIGDGNTLAGPCQWMETPKPLEMGNPLENSNWFAGEIVP